MAFRYCDVSLPVPLDQAFTYSVPQTLEHRVQPGCRLTVPFGSRKLTGVILNCHNNTPSGIIRSAFRLIDAEPVVAGDLMSLALWISGYYCAPLGEVLRSMLPIASEIRPGKTYTLTDAGRDAARQLLFGPAQEDQTVQILGALENRSLSATYLKRKFPLADKVLKRLEKRGFVAVDHTQTERDPFRAPSAVLSVQSLPSGTPEKLVAGAKMPKAERELLAFLELHPGAHNLAEVETQVKNASTAARSLARRKLLLLEERREHAPRNEFVAPHELNPGQQAAFAAIDAALQQGAFCPFLLHGVTGSGKTEVYLKAIEATLARSKSALLMVPEIALTPAMAGQFFSRFGDRVAILHSAFSDSERSGQWRKIRSGTGAVVVGTRSCVFAPVRDLGLIVVDEEHDQSYKQEENPRYHGRDVALVRAQHAGACVILGSATPSLESRYNAESGKYTLLELPSRVGERPMPEVSLIDMRQEFLETRKHATFSRAMLEQLQARLASGEQTIVLLNRRGFSSSVACRACGERVQCVNCSVTLTWHRRDRRLLCHYCNYAEKVPAACPKCESEHIYFLGIGSEKVEEELHQNFATARIARLDRDTAGGKHHYESILQAFRERSFDILVGTQMIAKGHDIPNVTLVGVVSADTGLGLPDFRAAERTFQLITQVAGRAGRGALPGVVLVQTVNPDHYAVRLAAAQDYAGFYAKELQFRRSMHYPPFTALANLLVRHEKQEDALRMSGELASHLGPAPERIRILGPAEAPVPRLKSEYRYQFLIKSASRKMLNQLLRAARDFARRQKWSATALVIDVDPLTLL